MAAIHTPDTSHPIYLNGIGAGATIGDLKFYAENTGGVPTCPGKSGALAFPTVTSNAHLTYCDVVFVADG